MAPDIGVTDYFELLCKVSVRVTIQPEFHVQIKVIVLFLQVIYLLKCKIQQDFRNRTFS